MTRTETVYRPVLVRQACPEADILVAQTGSAAAELHGERMRRKYLAGDRRWYASR
jgi:hypothetical protein